MEPATWLDDFHAALHKIADCQFNLDRLGDAMYIVGQDRMGQKLLDIAFELRDAHAQASKAISRELTETVKRSGDLLETVGLAALSGALTVLKSQPE